jgi:hypothetical protein
MSNNRNIANLAQVTATPAELNYLDVAVAGIAEESKAVVLSAAKDITGIHNIIGVEQTITFQSVASNGTSGSSKTINWGYGNKQSIEMTADCTFSFTAPDGPTNLILAISQDTTGSWTVTWPGNVKWPGGIEPTLTTTASATDLISFYYDGTYYYGMASLDFV